MRAKAIVDFPQRTFAEQMEVVVGDDAAEAVRVVDDGVDARLGVDVEAIVDTAVERIDARDLHVEQTQLVLPGHRQRQLARVSQEQFHGCGAWTKEPHHDSLAVTVEVRAEPFERVGLLAAQQGVQVGAHGRHGQPSYCGLRIQDCGFRIVDWRLRPRIEVRSRHEYIRAIRHDRG